MKIEKQLSENSYKLVERLPNGRIRVRTFNDDPSLTATEFAEDTDINNIMRKFEKTGQMTHFSSKPGVYADVSQYSDLLSASIAAKELSDEFSKLPSLVREKFQNDPHNLVAFLQDPRNYEEAVKLGLMTKVQQNDDKLNDDDTPAPKSKKAPKTPPPSTDEV